MIDKKHPPNLYLQSLSFSIWESLQGLMQSESITATSHQQLTNLWLTSE